MKKLISFCLALAMAASLAACSQGGSGSSTQVAGESISSAVEESSIAGEESSAAGEESSAAVILSRLVDTFISRILLTMLPVPNPHNTVCVLSWEEARHWQSRSSGYSSS